MSTTDIGKDVPTTPGGVRVERVVTSGTFELDGGSWEVDNNVWLVGDDRQVLVVDAAHDASAILEAVAGREVVAVVCTHGHNDHVNAVAELCAATGATSYLHPDDRVLWDMSQDQPPGAELSDGQTFTVGDVGLITLHTPGHAPGACCLHAPALGVVFSGDTLFDGGPGATGRSHSDFPTIIESIRTRLFELPPETVVLTGHGDPTVVGDETPHLQEWIERGS
ncbi:MBL fold metallo-hydrolase [Phycicoccus avicenniae]|uniref:MBL fold metallo-hydrolase n=1 Tax=Phycicoccus avicenniae TaxID=2828860 RepID=UPI002011294D|nr:MBL fold metallo-hydrolase [Phycicoccus avicenniae]